MPRPAPRTALRLVLDTNVVLSALLWSSSPNRLITLAAEGDAIALYTSPMLLDELAHTLGYARFARRMERYGTDIDALLKQYSELVTVVTPHSVPRVVPLDIDDDQVIAAAIAARADLIVTGDRRHLLPMGTYQGIPIVTPAQALLHINAAGRTYPSLH